MGACAEPVRCAVVGCGDVLRKYQATLPRYPLLRVVRCADLVRERAERGAAGFPGAIACAAEDVFTDSDVELVINLTPPQSHAEISMQALRSGKSVYSEKPLAADLAAASALLTEARERAVVIGCAPDTFLGTAGRVARRLIDEGQIGRPLGATAMMLSPGHERSCATPEVFYRRGAGPMLDMGVYYVTMLVSLLGPVRRATGMTGGGMTGGGMTGGGPPARTIDVGPRAGRTFAPEVATHVVASFDVWGTEAPHIEIYGTDGALVLPDPNFFAGPVRLRRARSSSWETIPLAADGVAGRGTGIADMAHWLRGLSASQRASGALGYHVLEIMETIERAGGSARDLESSCPRPSALPDHIRPGTCPWCQ
jgi:predicted dehydrogenase